MKLMFNYKFRFYTSKLNEICLHCHWLYFSSIIMSFGQSGSLGCRLVGGKRVPAGQLRPAFCQLRPGLLPPRPKLERFGIGSFIRLQGSDLSPGVICCRIWRTTRRCLLTPRSPIMAAHGTKRSGGNRQISKPARV